MTDKSAEENMEKEEHTEQAREYGESAALFNDPDYGLLIENYQQAEFDSCSGLLEVLYSRYPDSQRLKEIKEDLDLQTSLMSLEDEHLKTEKRQKNQKTLKLSVYFIFGIIMVLVIFILSYMVLGKVISEQMRDTKLSQASILEQQANDLLTSGQPAVASELVVQIRALIPTYPGLAELEERTNHLLQLEAYYRNASILLDEGKNAEALEILNSIEVQAPGLWDVPRLVKQAETGIRVQELILEGNIAYEKNYWKAVIDAFESALALDPDLNDSSIKEYLLNSYLQRIVQMLDSNSTTIEDIQLAEQYYRKAVAMIPQSKAFASERGNLAQVSSNLLTLKYTQTANTLLEERFQTFSSISSAVSYLNKAANLNPKNNELQQALKTGQLYQVAFQNVLEFNWSQAIMNLNQIVSIKPDYANGNARQLLYEAYYAIGKQYYSVGLYLDARSNLEQAEILAFDVSKNKLQLYQVQMALGDTLSKMEDYENAASYYRYAFNMVGVYSKAPVSSSLYNLVSTGDELLGQGDFQQAVDSYQSAGKEIAQIYTIQVYEAPDGTTLPFFAAEHDSTTEAIIIINKLSQNMTITFGRELTVPSIN